MHNHEIEPLPFKKPAPIITQQSNTNAAIMRQSKNGNNNMDALNQRISSLEQYLQKMGTQLDQEHDENKRLTNILQSKHHQSIKSVENDKEISLLTSTIAELRRNLNSTQQQLQKERQEYISSMRETENKLRILKTEHGAYKDKLHENVQQELDANNKINTISTENTQLRIEIDTLRKKIKDCNDIIASNDRSNKNLMKNLKNEKRNLINIINENEKKVNNLQVSIKTLKTENSKLESALKDRDNLHDKLLKNKKLYEDALGELLNAKKEQTELEKSLKQKMFTLNRLDSQIKAANEEKDNLNHQLKTFRIKYENERKNIIKHNQSEIAKIKSQLNYQQIKYDEMKSKHDNLKQRLLSKAKVCENLKDRINQQKSSFQMNLNELISNHTKELQNISNDTEEIKEVLSIMQDFSKGSNGSGVDPKQNKDLDQSTHGRIRGQSFVGIDDEKEDDHDNNTESLELTKRDRASLGIWEPHV